jgi:predicted nucleic acid-binding protein
MTFADRVRQKVRNAVDSSVLLDVLLPDPKFGPASAALLREAIDSGVIVACEIVWAEVRAAFLNDALFDDSMAKLGVQFDAVSNHASRMAGSIWRQYRSANRGSARAHLIPDFVVGAHALLQADVLLTRERGFYRRYFAKLAILDPSA